MKRQILGLALAAALFGAGQAQAILIDDYSDINPDGQLCPSRGTVATGQCVEIPADFGGPASNSDSGLSGVLGGTRAMSIALVSTSGHGDAGVLINSTPGLDFSNDANTDTTLTIDYSIPGGADLTQNTLPPGSPLGTGDADSFRWHITTLDINLLATVILEDADGTIGGNSFLKVPDEPCPGSPYVCVLPQPGAPPGNIYHTFDPFNTGGDDPARPGVSFYDDPANLANDTDLDPANNPGADGVLDFTNIVRISVRLDTNADTGTEGIDLIETCFDTVPLPASDASGVGTNGCSRASQIPEPGTVLLMGTGLLGIALVSARSRFSRRRRQQA